ncbi:Alpha/Beta hydrolase protein [Roridomyces roridus]|uniref:Alpha/Beta hydrolase protein n=1 Tax=Roridomyces roridus TaxID=1738132 RepID=A0AAD7FWA1_9AGAR|nr:Alpha/Beta hydrolase protein [Roridomyces roridus]
MSVSPIKGLPLCLLVGGPERNRRGWRKAATPKYCKEALIRSGEDHDDGALGLCRGIFAARAFARSVGQVCQKRSPLHYLPHIAPEWSEAGGLMRTGRRVRVEHTFGSIFHAARNTNSGGEKKSSYTGTAAKRATQIIHHAHPHAIPIILMHGWPGSFSEFAPIIKPLSQTGKTSTGKNVSFNVVVPSLPGFVFSSPATSANWTYRDTARVFNTLMTEVLGYSTYSIHGTDWTYLLTFRAAHFSFLPFVSPSPEDLAAKNITISSVQNVTERKGDLFASIGFSYFNESAQKPNDIGLALYDSPTGQLAWIAAKMKLWSDPRAGTPPSQLTSTAILTAVSLYYLTSTFLSSIWIYGSNPAVFRTEYTPAPTDAPFLFSQFEYNSGLWPEEYVANVTNNLVRSRMNVMNLFGWLHKSLSDLDLRSSFICSPLKCRGFHKPVIEKNEECSEGSSSYRKGPVTFRSDASSSRHHFLSESSRLSFHSVSPGVTNVESDESHEQSSAGKTHFSQHGFWCCASRTHSAPSILLRRTSSSSSDGPLLNFPPATTAPMMYYRPTPAPMPMAMPISIPGSIPMTIPVYAPAPVVNSTSNWNLNPPTLMTNTTNLTRKRKFDNPAWENDAFNSNSSSMPLDEYPDPLACYPSGFGRDANAASRILKRRRVEEYPIHMNGYTEPQFLCAGCKREYFQIADHFRGLDYNSPCAAQVFHVKVGYGKWGGGISYPVWAKENAGAQWALRKRSAHATLLLRELTELVLVHVASSLTFARIRVPQSGLRRRQTQTNSKTNWAKKNIGGKIEDNSNF